MDEAVIVDVGDSVAYATTMCLARCIAFAENLGSRIWIGCDGKTSITP